MYTYMDVLSEINLIIILLYDAPLAIVVQYTPPLPADSSKIVQCQKLIVLTYIYIYAYKTVLSFFLISLISQLP